MKRYCSRISRASRILGFLALLLFMAVLAGCVFIEEFISPILNPTPPREREAGLVDEDVRPVIVPRVSLTPALPVRGGHVVIEVGPFDHDPQVTVIKDMRGDLSLPFRQGNKVYYLLAVSYFNEPGKYPLSFEILDGEGWTWAQEVMLEVVEGEFTHQKFSVSASRTQGWTNKQLEEDREKTRKAREHTNPSPLWQGPFMWPLEGRVSSDYGALRTINNAAPTRHNGIDIAAPEGTPLAAANDGFVRLAEHLLAGGNTVIIDHGLDVCSVYLHMHEIWVEEGQWVSKGEVIGTVGQTGFATGPHLHWSVYVGHSPVSPYCFMEEGAFSPTQ
jgi:hypothetical protein